MISEIPLVMFAEAMDTLMFRNLQPPVEGAREPVKSTTKSLRNTENAVAATDQAGPAQRISGELPKSDRSDIAVITVNMVQVSM